jgi:predicted amidohydrolase
MMPARDLPPELKSASETQSEIGDWLERGGSAIIGPDTHYVVEPVFDREELIVADLNLNEIDQELMTFDASGHYARPDVFTFDTKSEQVVRTSLFGAKE